MQCEVPSACEFRPSTAEPHTLKQVVYTEFRPVRSVGVRSNTFWLLITVNNQRLTRVFLCQKKKKVKNVGNSSEKKEISNTFSKT